MRIAMRSAVLVVAALVGCDQVDTNTAPLPNTAAPAPSAGNSDATPAASEPSAQTTGPSGIAPATAPDNTDVNKRDAEGNTKTPIDQDENQADVNRTAEIRKRLLDTPDMSINARNAKIITSQGKVTLRGPVNSEAERDALVKIATEVAGAENVDNQLDVAPAQPER